MHYYCTCLFPGFHLTSILSSLLVLKAGKQYTLSNMILFSKGTVQAYKVPSNGKVACNIWALLFVVVVLFMEDWIFFWTKNFESILLSCCGCCCVKSAAATRCLYHMGTITQNCWLCFFVQMENDCFTVTITKKAIRCFCFVNKWTVSVCGWPLNPKWYLTSFNVKTWLW